MIKSGHSYTSTDFSRCKAIIIPAEKNDMVQEYGKRVQFFFWTKHTLSLSFCSPSFAGFFYMIKWTIHCCINSMGSITSSIERMHARKFNGQIFFKSPYEKNESFPHEKRKNFFHTKKKTRWNKKSQSISTRKTILHESLPVEMIYSCWK